MPVPFTTNGLEAGTVLLFMILSTSNDDGTCDGGGFLGRCAGAPYFCCRESSLGIGNDELLDPLSKLRGPGVSVVASVAKSFEILFPRLEVDDGDGFFRPLRPTLRLEALLGTNDRV